MTGKEFGLDYASCSLGELQTFVKARRIDANPSKCRDKASCISILKQADSDASFRFLNLPGEMRNRIYCELLLFVDDTFTGYEHKTRTIQRKAPECHPQILATCSAIRNEASSILYGLNEANVEIRRTITINGAKIGQGSHSVHVSRLPMEVKYVDGAFGALRTHYQEWPSSLLKFEKVRIQLRTESITYAPYEGRYHTKLSHSLYSLVSFLQRSRAIREITIAEDAKIGNKTIPAEAFKRCLYPLARLFANFPCKVEGFQDYPEFASYFQSLVTQYSEFYKLNVLHKASLVRDESNAYRILAEISSEKANWREHSRLRGIMFRVFNLSFNEQQDEGRMMDWSEKMAPFLTKMYNEETVPILQEASGFWLKAANGFQAAHKKRLKYFPQ